MEMKVNIPLDNALTEIPEFAKYIKEFVINMRVIDCETVAMPHLCGAVMIQK